MQRLRLVSVERLDSLPGQRRRDDRAQLGGNRDGTGSTRRVGVIVDQPLLAAAFLE